MGVHKWCTVGEYHHDDGSSEIVTLEELKAIIKERKKYNASIRESGFSDVDWMYKTEYTLSDYADRRKSTNFFRFTYCPFCGRKIDWNKIKKGLIK